jgi:3-oxoacyl-[acyl-carrier protein] reductase
MSNALIIGCNNEIGCEVSKILNNREFEVYGASHSKLNDDSNFSKIFPLDLTDNQSINEFLLNIENLDKSFEFVFFISGFLSGESIRDIDRSDIMNSFHINVIGQIRIFQGLMPRMPSACLALFMSSISATNGSYDAVYSASKAAVEGFVKAVAVSDKFQGRINALAPGLIRESKMYQKFSTKQVDAHLDQTPTRMLTTVDQVARVACGLIDAEWSNLNGQVIHINGGRRV